MALYLKDVDPSKLSQGMRQYYDFKIKHLDKIVFFRLGDFYEMFFDDAYAAAKALDLTLTGKDCGLSERAPMCGVPFHACDQYIRRLIESGYKVVICEQMEDPALAKGIVKRDIIRIVTPGTVTDGDMLDEGANNWLASVYPLGRAFHVCFADMSTGEAHLYSVSGKDCEQDLIDLLSRFLPVEVISTKELPKYPEVSKFISDKLLISPAVLEDALFDVSAHSDDIVCQFSLNRLEDIGVPSDDDSLCAVAGLCSYIRDTRRVSVGRFSALIRHADEQVMQLGFTARTNLELTRTIRGGDKKGTLRWVLDKTETPMGRRALKTWIEQPLISPYRIISRLDAVEELTKSGALLLNITDSLSGVRDLERLMTRVLYKTARPIDLKALSETSFAIRPIKLALKELSSKLLRELDDGISSLGDISELIESAISDSDEDTKDGGYIKPGFNAELDSLRSVRENAQKIIDGIVERERERTGIRNLKVGYNRVFGYYIEVTRSFYDLVPPDYIRKQTLANCERFITEELKKTEEEILGAEEKISVLEADLFAQVRDFIASKLTEVQKTSESLASLDILVSFANVALSNNYTRPDIAIDGVINIKNGRHPVVELTLEDEAFVPNDTYLDLGSNRMSIITGPNMSGKSTYMRQVALITLMAQIGSFVPADYAKISVVDRIFTRVGASDDLAAGRSTFMVEMSEVAEIVKNATKNSLVILDEVGRGTSTCDGISIARATAEYIADPRQIGCKTLFATHYHELIAMEGEVPGVLNYSVAVRKTGDSVRFLRKIVRGGADESYGIEVAKLAGLPKKLVDRARAIMPSLEVTPALPQTDGQMTFDKMGESAAIDRLKKTNIDELSDGELRALIEEIIGILR